MAKPPTPQAGLQPPATEGLFGRQLHQPPHRLPEVLFPGVQERGYSDYNRALAAEVAAVPPDPLTQTDQEPDGVAPGLGHET